MHSSGQLILTININNLYFSHSKPVKKADKFPDPIRISY